VSPLIHKPQPEGDAVTDGPGNNDTANRSILLPVLAAAGAMAAFQIGAALAKTLFPAVGAQGAAALRLFFGSLMLLALVRPWRFWPQKTADKRAVILPLIALGAAIAGAMQMFYLAIERLPIGVAIALQFLGPLGIALVSSRKPVDLVWIAFAALGVWFLTDPASAGVSLDPVGVAWSLGAAACWAAYIVMGRYVSGIFGRATAPLTVGIAALIIMPIGVAHAGAALLDLSLMPVAILMALFSAAIPFVLEFFAMPRMPARTFATLTSLEPGFGVLFGFVMLQEVLTLPQLGGVGLVIAASAGAIWTGQARPPAAPPVD
jgi:inner membrane transporter RhtA